MLGPPCARVCDFEEGARARCTHAAIGGVASKLRSRDAHENVLHLPEVTESIRKAVGAGVLPIARGDLAIGLNVVVKPPSQALARFISQPEVNEILHHCDLLKR